MTDRKSYLRFIALQPLGVVASVADFLRGEAQGDANRWLDEKLSHDQYMVNAGRWNRLGEVGSEFGFMFAFLLGFLKGRKTGPVALCRSLCHTV